MGTGRLRLVFKGELWALLLHSLLKDWDPEVAAPRSSGCQATDRATSSNYGTNHGATPMSNDTRPIRQTASSPAVTQHRPSLEGAQGGQGDGHSMGFCPPRPFWWPLRCGAHLCCVGVRDWGSLPGASGVRVLRQT